MNLLDALGGDETARCSRAGCSEPAAWALDWRNPRIHDATRRKTWLACGEHREYLEDFLRSREFPVEARAFSRSAEGTL